MGKFPFPLVLSPQFEKTMSAIWGGDVRYNIKHVENFSALQSLCWFGVGLVVGLLFLVPFVSTLSVWPAYGWVYMLLVMVMYAVVIATIHNTSSQTTVAWCTFLFCLAALVNLYSATVLVAWAIMTPLGLVPARSANEFAYSLHVILAALHLWRMVYDLQGVWYLVDVSREVSKRRKALRLANGGRLPDGEEDSGEELHDMQ
jgi:hypothetical protein